MALSPADFYAYSNATGVPVPETAEERAVLAPAVLDFRRNQLKPQEQNSNNLLAIGASALAGAAAFGAGIAARRFLRGQPKVPKAPTRSANAGVVQQDLENLQRAAGRASTAEASVPTSKVAQPGAPTPEERQRVYASVAAKPVEELPRVYRPKGDTTEEVLMTDPRTGEMFIAGQSPKSFAEQYVSLRPALTGQKTDLPIARTPGTFKAFSQAAQNIAIDPTDRLLAELKDMRAMQSQELQERMANAYSNRVDELLNTTLVDKQRQTSVNQQQQTASALDSGEDQISGRIKQRLQQNEDLDLSQVELLEEMSNRSYQQMMDQPEPIVQAASMLPDGPPVDQTRGLNVLSLETGSTFQVSPRSLNITESNYEDDLVQSARRYLLAKEVDTDFDYSQENQIQAAQVQDRIQRAKQLQEEGNRILDELKLEGASPAAQLSPQEFASAFNKQYREELNQQLNEVDNARQRAELLSKKSGEFGEDLESLLTGEKSLIESTMRGRALRGGKPNVTGQIIYQDPSGAFVSADTSLKTRLNQGEQFKQRARLLNTLNTLPDEALNNIVLQNQEKLQLNKTINQSEADALKFASEILRTRAVTNQEPTRIQLDALERSRASIEKSQEILSRYRNLKPTVAPGPGQDVARAMETLRRGMEVEPSEPIPQYPSVQTLRTGFVSDEEIGPVLGASDVYTGAAAEAAGPVIFTGKSKANTVLSTPPITGSIRTSAGRYLTQNNPDVLGTVYNVAGTPANRAISAQIEQNAQDFLQDAIAGGLTQKTQRPPEPYRTPGTYGVIQMNLFTPSIPKYPLSQPQLGLSGPAPDIRTLYSQYRPGRSASVRQSPFIGEMAGGTVVVVPPSTTAAVSRRDVGAPSASVDLTRRGEKSKYYSLYPEKPFITGMEPAPIGPVRPSPGLSRIGAMTQTVKQGAGNIPVTQLTPYGQKIAYPRMDKLVTVPGYGDTMVSNIPRYGINPGAEDWREDLMRSEYRRGGPVRTYQG